MYREFIYSQQSQCPFSLLYISRRFWPSLPQILYITKLEILSSWWEAIFLNGKVKFLSVCEEREEILIVYFCTKIIPWLPACESWQDFYFLHKTLGPTMEGWEHDRGAYCIVVQDLSTDFTWYWNLSSHIYLLKLWYWFKYPVA